MNMRKLGLAVLALTAAAACAPRTDTQSLTIKGSDTMVQLGARWAEAYMNEHPDAAIQVTGGGSGTGIAALINGTTDIAQASRMMREEEKAAALAERGAEVVEVSVALDALAVYVHVDNPVRELSVEQVSGIFRGEITSWSEVGGPDADIVLYGRASSSGTYGFFREHVMADADFAPAYQGLPGTAAVINAVAADPVGVGYGGIGYGEGVSTLWLRPTPESSPVEPSMANVFTNTYPLSRDLYFYTVGEPTGLAAEFIAWVLGPDGQALVEEVGYYPLRSDSASLRP